MKKYIIKDTDLMINGSIVPEGSKIDLNDEDAKLLSPYLIQVEEETEKKKINVKGNKNEN